MLHSHWSVLLATLFGTAVAGGFLISINLLRLKQPWRAALAFITAIALTGLCIAADLTLATGGFCLLALTIVMPAFAALIHRRAYAIVGADSGLFEPLWKAPLIGLAFSLVLGAVALVLVFFWA